MIHTDGHLTDWSDVEFELVPHTLGVVPGYEGGEGGLVGDQLALVVTGPVLLPVHSHQPAITELLHPPAPELSLHLHLEVPGELPVVAGPVERLLGLGALPALDPAVDDVDGGPEAWRDPVPPVL